MYFLCVPKESTKENPQEAALRVRSLTREKSARNKLAQTELLVFLIFPFFPHRLQGDPGFGAEIHDPEEYQNANSRWSVLTTSSWAFESIVPSFLVSLDLSRVLI